MMSRCSIRRNSSRRCSKNKRSYRVSTHKPFDPFDPANAPAGATPNISSNMSQGVAGNIGDEPTFGTAQPPIGGEAPIPISPAQQKKNKKDGWWHGFIKPIGLMLVVLFSARSIIIDWNDV